MQIKELIIALELKLKRCLTKYITALKIIAKKLAQFWIEFLVSIVNELMCLFYLLDQWLPKSIGQVLAKVTCSQVVILEKTDKVATMGNYFPQSIKWIE